MKITRINKIKRHRVFQDFSWPNELPEFARFNLLYGWNGCGKTTLSNLIRFIERKENIVEGECEFRIDQNNHQGNALSGVSGLPRVRVFNRDFVAANFSATAPELSLDPIYFLGEDSVEKQKQIESLKTKLDSENAKITTKQRAKADATTALDGFCVQEAKAIKDLLSSSPPNSYNTYDKRNFRFACETQKKPGAASLKPLTEEKKADLKQQKDDKPKDKLPELKVELPEASAIRDHASALLQRTVISQVLDELVKDADLAEWVQHGLEFHRGDYAREDCRFCGKPISKERLAKLEAHFNDEYNRLITEVDAAVKDIDDRQATLKELKIPDKAQFYDHISTDFAVSRSEFEKSAEAHNVYLDKIKSALRKKRAKPFEAMSLESLIPGFSLPDIESGSKALTGMNSFVAQHNTESDNFQKTVSQARKDLEDSLVAEALAEFEKKTVAIEAAEKEFQDLSRDARELKGQIDELEKQIVSHRRPKEELNTELRNYLGRDELQFEFRDPGYQITRNGLPASNLSEGERTAIAFLYFLKSLQGSDFTLSHDIVVIDDPVSSLDANSLFCAFGYMKARTREAGQLFILTHNFTFFRQARNWFHNLRGPDRKQARFYFIETEMRGGKRNASITQLDRLLREFESEYHYLFKRVYDEAKKAGERQPLEEYYHLPNLGRRLLEAFFAFRFPQERGDLYKQLERAKCSAATGARLVRFLDTYSHNQTVGETGQDLSILTETPQILKDLMELIKAEDPSHFEEMEKLLAETSSD